jgi:hypothetical protein
MRGRDTGKIVSTDFATSSREYNVSPAETPSAVLPPSVCGVLYLQDRSRMMTSSIYLAVKRSVVASQDHTPAPCNVHMQFIDLRGSSPGKGLITASTT